MKIHLHVSAAIALFLMSSCTHSPTPEQPDTTHQKTKNVILMISDGIGFNGWLATDYYQGLAGKQTYQKTRPDGTKPLVLGLAHGALNIIDENGDLLPRDSDFSLAAGVVEQGYDPATRWNRFENAMINDFSPIEQSYTSYTDSAAAGTALMSGQKTSVGRINVDWTGEKRFMTIAEIAMDHGLSAGIVTSVMVSHATPASVIAHNNSRDNYSDIFNEMVASGLDVIMGAGHPLYDNSGDFAETDSEKNYKYVGGKESFLAMKSDVGFNGYAFTDSRLGFENLMIGENPPSRVIGIARTGSTLQALRDGSRDPHTPSGIAFNHDVPDLSTMSLGALNVLSQQDGGFFVMIEGGAVDWMGHANDMPRFIEEQIDFNQAVDAVISWVETNSNWEETLLIVTSDHECGGIWGEGTWTNSDGGAVASDRSEEALMEARFNPSEDTFNDFLVVQDRGKGNIPGHQWASRNHTNDLVPLWAIGAGGERFNEFVQTDSAAQKLWGREYGWNGNYVDNTMVFRVMETALRR